MGGHAMRRMETITLRSMATSVHGVVKSLHGTIKIHNGHGNHQLPRTGAFSDDRVLLHRKETF